ncbi:hypothetical protein SARC_15911, partial [Sphaeroforma arctica JP610]
GRGFVEPSRLLLQSTADVDAVTNKGRSALHFAAKGPHPAMVRLLLQAGADCNLVDGDGVSPLALAVRSGCITSIAYLLSYGADTRTLPSMKTDNKNERKAEHKFTASSVLGELNNAPSLSSSLRCARLLVAHGVGTWSHMPGTIQSHLIKEGT